MHTHEDLMGNRGTNPGEIPGNGRDDDGNGYVVSAAQDARSCRVQRRHDTGSLRLGACKFANA